LLGKTTASSKILQANPGLDPKNLKEGTVIQIPEASGAKA
jgi:phage tail protein X